MYCFAWGGIVYSFMPFSFESMYRLVWGGIGISTFLPEPPPYLGQGYTIWYKYRTIPQLNKIRILFNSQSLYTSIYTYTTAYHCILCLYITVYHLHLPLQPDYHTMHKRIQARTSAYTIHCICRAHSQAPERGRRYARQSPKKCGYRAILYALYMVYIPLPTTKKHRKKSLS